MVVNKIMAFMLKATNKRTGGKSEYGPWPADANPMVAAARLSFAQGFVCGVNAALNPESAPDELDFEVVEVSEDTNVVGQLVAEAAASVTHADGTTD